jgi:hypothetical protein
LILMQRPLPAEPLVERRRFLTVVPRPMPAAPRRFLIVLPRPMPAAAGRYLAVVPRPSPAAPLVVHRRYLIAAPGRCPRRRSLCVAGTWSWCPGGARCASQGCVHLFWGPGRCPRRRKSLCVKGTWPLRPAVARGAAQIGKRCVQTIARGGVCCVSRVLDRGA